MDGVARPLLTHARKQGLVVGRDGDLLILDGPYECAELAGQLIADKHAVFLELDLEEAGIQRRVDAFRPRVPTTGPIPFLTMTTAIERGRCLSCSGPDDDKYETRCDLCAEAIRRVIAEVDVLRREDVRR